MVRVETDKTASDIQARSFMARTLERNAKERSAEGEALNAQLKNRSSIMLEDYEESISLILRTRSLKKPLGMLYALHDMQEEQEWEDP